MARKRPTIELRAGDRLRDSEHRGTSMELPAAIHHRLDLLAEAADSTNATRAEVVAMLIGEAEIDTDALELAILRYRKKLVGEVVPERGEGDENVISFERRGPGRPKKNAAN